MLNIIICSHLYRYIIYNSFKIYIQESQHLNQKVQRMCLKICLKYLSHEEVDIIKNIHVSLSMTPIFDNDNNTKEVLL